MMTYAFSLANGVWLLGLERLGLGVGLKGNGMCFSSRGLRRFPWRAYGLVEDMEFALMLRARGERVRFLPEARVFGEMVSRGGPGAASQRRRWEAGRRSLRGKFAGPLARSPFARPVSQGDVPARPLLPAAGHPGARPGRRPRRRISLAAVDGPGARPPARSCRPWGDGGPPGRLCPQPDRSS